MKVQNMALINIKRIQFITVYSRSYIAWHEA